MNNRILGFSCVENHVLDFLQPRCENPGLLYFDCFMPLDKIYESAKRDSFEYFSGVHRIQDALKNNSLLEIKLYTTDFSDFTEHIKSIDNNIQVLMLIKPLDTQKNFCARGLREDHYVDVYMRNNKYILTNDIPHKKIEINKNELENLYMNYFLEFVYKPFYSDNMLLSLEKQRIYPIVKSARNIDPRVAETEDFLMTFRNTLVIFKTMRARLNAYLNAKGYFYDISCEIEAITKVLAQTEYIRLRKISGKSKYVELINYINEIDRQIFNKIKGVLNDRDNQ